MKGRSVPDQKGASVWSWIHGGRSHLCPGGRVQIKTHLTLNIRKIIIIIMWSNESCCLSLNHSLFNINLTDSAC